MKFISILIVLIILLYRFVKWPLLRIGDGLIWPFKLFWKGVKLFWKGIAWVFKKIEGYFNGRLILSDKMNLAFPVIFIAIMWISFLVQRMLHIPVESLSIIPRSMEGLKGVIFAPLLHLNFDHITNNTLGVFIYVVSLSLFYKKIAFRVFIYSWFLSGIMLWLLATNNIIVPMFGEDLVIPMKDHYILGSSAMIFSVVGFIMSYGFFTLNRMRIYLSIILGIFYGWAQLSSMLPVTNSRSNWILHLFGFIAGIMISIYFTVKEKLYDK